MTDPQPHSPLTDAADRPVDLAFDARHVWHPYAPLDHSRPVFAVRATHGSRIELDDGRTLIDGMASWWTAIHGYRHPHIEQAVAAQLARMPHVMFGGLTHAPAVELVRRLVAMTPPPLDAVFLADSGSVSVEVALKMALQFQAVRGAGSKQRIGALRGGYHGDTFGAMSVCDPERGMHQLFRGMLPEAVFFPRPVARYGERALPSELAAVEQQFTAHAHELAAVIVEPLVQGAGGMWFYSADLLKKLRALCDEHEVLLIFDEIATGFGRTGALFACERAEVTPDILCLGKALTGGTLTLAATLATRAIADTLSREGPGALMHGPTFMGNPLACAAANASLELLEDGAWATEVRRVEQALRRGLAPARTLKGVADVRVLGAIGVIERHEPVDMSRAPHEFVARGVWVRPFANLIYVMPPYTCTDDELAQLTQALCEVAELLDKP